MSKKKKSSNPTDLNNDLPNTTQSLGEFLKNSRTSQNKSLEDISNATGILVSKLQALENNNQNELPAEVFVRGFVRMYSKELNVDPLYATKLYEEGNEFDANNKKTPTSLEGEKLATQLFDGRIIKYVLLIVFISSCFFAFDAFYPQLTDYLAEQKQLKEKRQLTTLEETLKETERIKKADSTSEISADNKNIESSKPVISQTVNSPPEPETPSPITSDPGQVNSLVNQVQTTKPQLINNSPSLPSVPPAPTENQLSESVNDLPSKPPQDESQTVLQENLPTPVTENIEQKTVTQINAQKQKIVIKSNETLIENHNTSLINSDQISDSSENEEINKAQQVLQIDFSEKSWIRVSIDSLPPFEKIFQAGETYTWHALNSIDLYLGNAGGSTLTLNGIPMPINNESGHTVRIQIP